MVSVYLDLLRNTIAMYQPARLDLYSLNIKEPFF